MKFSFGEKKKINVHFVLARKLTKSPEKQATKRELLSGASWGLAEGKK